MCVLGVHGNADSEVYREVHRQGRRGGRGFQGVVRRGPQPGGPSCPEEGARP